MNLVTLKCQVSIVFFPNNARPIIKLKQFCNITYELDEGLYLATNLTYFFGVPFPVLARVVEKKN